MKYVYCWSAKDQICDGSKRRLIISPLYVRLVSVLWLYLEN